MNREDNGFSRRLFIKTKRLNKHKKLLDRLTIESDSSIETELKLIKNKVMFNKRIASFIDMLKENTITLTDTEIAFLTASGAYEETI